MMKVLNALLIVLLTIIDIIMVIIYSDGIAFKTTLTRLLNKTFQ